MNATKETEKIQSSLKKVNEEAQSIYQLLMDDLGGTSISLKIIECFTCPCTDIKEVFDIKTRFNISFEMNWSNNTIKEMNSGMSGLILDELSKDNVFSQVVFDKFFLTLNQFLSRNNILKAMLLNRAIEEIERKYRNKYKLVDIKNISTNFIKRKDGNTVPNIDIEIQLERN